MKYGMDDIGTEHRYQCQLSIKFPASQGVFRPYQIRDNH